MHVTRKSPIPIVKPVRRTTTFKELQATPLEKFCIRYIYVTVILALEFILAFVCADALRMLLIGVIDGEYVCGLPVLINEMSHANTQPVSRCLLHHPHDCRRLGHRGAEIIVERLREYKEEVLAVWGAPLAMDVK